jgi:hypothetical protein
MADVRFDYVIVVYVFGKVALKRFSLPDNRPFMVSTKRLSLTPLLQPLKLKTPRSESASELYRPSDRRLSAKWLPTFADRGVPRGQRAGSLRPYSRFSRQEPLLLLLQPLLFLNYRVILKCLRLLDASFSPGGPELNPAPFYEGSMTDQVAGIITTREREIFFTQNPPVFLSARMHPVLASFDFAQ